MLDIKGIDKALLLVCLFNRSKQQGMGFLDDRGVTTLQPGVAAELVSKQTYFDYLFGRVMKVEIGGDTLNPYLYDRDNGEGAASEALDILIKRDY